MGEVGGVKDGAEVPGEGPGGTGGLSPPCTDEAGEGYAEHRPLLFSIAYRMTGSVSDAEDIVQEAFARLTQALRAGTPVSEPRAYLVRTATRLALNHLRSARLHREFYLGTWLPEPVLTGPDPRSKRRWPTPVHGIPCHAGVLVTSRAGRIPAARGVRLRAQGDRRDNRHV